MIEGGRRGVGDMVLWREGPQKSSRTSVLRLTFPERPTTGQRDGRKWPPIFLLGRRVPVPDRRTLQCLMYFSHLIVSPDVSK